MPKVKISEYSATANSNTDVASINIDEGCAPSGINNAIRAVMGHLKDFQQGTNGDPFNGPVNGTLGATTPSTVAATTLTTSSTVTHNGGTANGVAYLNGSKVLTTGSALVFDGSTLTNTGVGYSINNANALLRFGNAAATRTGYLQVRSDAFEIWSDQFAVPMVFGTSNTEQMRLTSTGLKTKTTISVGDATPSSSGAGITFPATQSASSDANTLDDYEEGTWTPVVNSGYTGVTYSNQIGRYTKIGRLVTLTCYLQFSGTSNATGIQVASLPFDLVTGTYGNSGSIGYWDVTTDGNLSAYVASSTEVQFYKIGSSSTALSTGNVTNKYIIFSITGSI